MRLKNTATLLTFEVNDDHEQIIAELVQILQLLSLAHMKIAQTNLFLHYFERAGGDDEKVIVVGESSVEIDEQGISFDICARKIVKASLPTSQRLMLPLRLCDVRVFDLENPDVAVWIDGGELTVRYWQFLDEVNYTEAQFVARVMALKNDFGK
ncbi:MAG: hypothetical protein V4495_21690 [Pseudomonadota bacterium]